MKVLFVCAENTCRSQMAEALAKSLDIEAESAGITTGACVNEYAVTVMKEVGVDISGYQTKSIDKIDFSHFDFIISLCSAKTAALCPSTFTGDKEDWNIDDPKGQSLDEYRRVRDLLDARIQNMHFQK